MELDFEMAAKNFAHHRGLTATKEPVIDKDASELIANRFMDQRCGHARIDPAAQAEDHALLADLVPNFADRLLQIIVHGPIATASADMMDKIADDFRAARRVYDFR